MYYAQLNAGKVCAVTETYGVVDSPNMIALESLDTSLLGYSYVSGVFIPPTPPTPSPDPCEWLINVGPFFDRFGATKMAVLTSTDAGVKAILQDVSVRMWIDLQRADVSSALAYIGSVVPAVDSTLQTAILTTPVTLEENRALRKQFF